jgi:hypothetical protein
MLDFTKDLSAFIGHDFGQVVTLDGQPVSVIFDNGYAFGDVGLIGMASSQPTICLPTSQVPADPIGKTVLVGAVSYQVATHEPDGAGVSHCKLERAT